MALKTCTPEPACLSLNPSFSIYQLCNFQCYQTVLNLSFLVCEMGNDKNSSDFIRSTNLKRVNTCKILRTGLTHGHHSTVIIISSLSPQSQGRHPSISNGYWFQDPLLITKSEEAQVPYIKRCGTVGHWFCIRRFCNQLNLWMQKPRIWRVNCTATLLPGGKDR